MPTCVCTCVYVCLGHVQMHARIWDVLLHYHETHSNCLILSWPLEHTGIVPYSLVSIRYCYHNLVTTYLNLSCIVKQFSWSTIKFVGIISYELIILEHYLYHLNNAVYGVSRMKSVRYVSCRNLAFSNCNEGACQYTWIMWGSVHHKCIMYPTYLAHLGKAFDLHVLKPSCPPLTPLPYPKQNCESTPLFSHTYTYLYINVGVCLS